MQIRRRSSLWFLLPIIFNLIGGVIAYFIIKEDDPKKAKNCLYLGIILAAIPTVLILIPMLIGVYTDSICAYCKQHALHVIKS